MNHSEYKHYQTEDFILDDFFQRWVGHQDEGALQFWPAWVEAHPEKKEAVEQAVLFLGRMQFPKESLVPNEVDALLSRIEQDIHAAPPAAVILFRRPDNNIWLRVAAVFALFLLSAGILWVWSAKSNYIVEQTAYGATKEVYLPDSSRVTLNGNSSLRFAESWDSSSPREVWLEGEGFFSVIHKRNNQKFIVHTSDKLDVEVLGTTFTVAKRSAGVRVVLNSGKVRLDLHRKEEERYVTMRPGDLVQLKYKSGELEKRRVNPAMYSAWTRQTLMFENTTLREVASLLKQTYGLQVVIADSSLYDMKVSGSTPINRGLDMFFTGLEAAFDLKVSRENSKVLIERRPSGI